MPTNFYLFFSNSSMSGGNDLLQELDLIQLWEQVKHFPWHYCLCNCSWSLRRRQPGRGDVCKVEEEQEQSGTSGMTWSPWM